jgi:hypothetical protein
MDDFRNKVIVKGSCVKFENSFHRVDRVLGSFSSRPNWDSPTPSPAGKCAPPPLVPGGTHSLEGEGLGDPNYNEGTDTVVLSGHYIYVLCDVLPTFLFCLLKARVKGPLRTYSLTFSFMYQ